MRLLRFYVPFQLVAGERYFLPEDVFKHAIKVLRLPENSEIVLFCGDNNEYQCRLIDVQKRSAQVEIIAVENADRESPLKIHLIQGVSKGDRMDFVCQKATELGVESITPVFTERTNISLSGERLQKKLSHWQAIAVSSCEQCGRNSVPKIHSAENYIDAIKSFSDSKIGKLVLSPTSSTSLKSYQNKYSEVVAVIGPEGGLSKNEIEIARLAGFAPVTFGPRILRTETAAVAFLALSQGLWGDLT